jgi:hypothetical protein
MSDSFSANSDNLPTIAAFLTSELDQSFAAAQGVVSYVDATIDSFSEAFSVAEKFNDISIQAGDIELDSSGKEWPDTRWINGFNGTTSEEATTSSGNSDIAMASGATWGWAAAADAEDVQWFQPASGGSGFIDPATNFTEDVSIRIMFQQAMAEGHDWEGNTYYYDNYASPIVFVRHTPFPEQIRTIFPEINSDQVNELYSSSFDFTIPEYTQEYIALVTEKIRQLTGGTPLVSQEVWDAKLFQEQNVIAESQVAAHRKQRNSGAASFWGLPTESFLSQARNLSSEILNKQNQLVRATVKEQVEIATKDYWTAIEQAIGYERILLAYNAFVADTGLAVAEEAFNVSAKAFNMEVSVFNAEIEAEKKNIQLVDEKKKRSLRLREMELKQQEAVLTRFSTEQKEQRTKIDVLKKDIETGNLIDNASMLWNQVEGQVAAQERNNQLDHQQNSMELNILYADRLKANFAALATARKIQRAQFTLPPDRAEAEVKIMNIKNQVNMMLDKMKLAADAANLEQAHTGVLLKAKVDASVDSELLRAYSGYQQAMTSASNITYGTQADVNTTYSNSYHETNSLNQEKVW